MFNAKKCISLVNNSTTNKIILWRPRVFFTYLYIFILSDLLPFSQIYMSMYTFEKTKAIERVSTYSFIWRKFPLSNHCPFIFNNETQFLAAIVIANISGKDNEFFLIHSLQKKTNSISLIEIFHAFRWNWLE